jgi:HEAT repeat protein
MALLAAAMLPCWGCGLTPHSFRKLQPPAATVRARSVGAGPRDPDLQVVPALVARLEDEDPVVRLAASEELRKRTGQDFGFVAWASSEERAGAIARWRSWLKAPPMPADSIKPSELPPLPAELSQAARRPARRRRARAQAPPTTTPAPATSENAAS